MKGDVEGLKERRTGERESIGTRGEQIGQRELDGDRKRERERAINGCNERAMKK